MHRLSFLAALLAAPVFAQPPGGSTDVARTAAPFIDEHTLVVARVDVTRLDIAAVLKLASLVAGQGEEGGDAAPGIRANVKKLLAAGGKEVFVTYGPGDFPNLPCLIVPAPDDPAAQKTIGEMLAQLYVQFDK